MELSAFTTKLLEALEKCNVSTGAERRCPDGPQGQPNRDLVRAFEEALNRPDTSPEVQGCSAPLSPEVPGAEGEQVAFDRIEAPDVVQDPSRVDAMYNDMGQENVPGVTADTLSSGEVRDVGTGAPPAGTDTSLEELARLLNKVGSGNPTPAELYRLQYLVGMLKMQASGGAQLSQHVGQGFESLLKQQG